MKKIPLCITIFLIIALLGMAISLQRVTFIDWWLPVVCAFIISVPSGYAMQRPVSHLTRRSSQLLNILCGAIVAFAFTVGGFYSLNFCLSDKQSQRIESGKVIAKRSIERHHSRRVGRNRYVPGEKYYVYRLDILLPNAHRTSLDVSPQEYIHTRHGTKIPVRIERGLFGFDVIKNTPHPATRKKQ